MSTLSEEELMAALREEEKKVGEPPVPLPDLSDALSKLLDMDRCSGTIILGLVPKARRIPQSLGAATDGVHLFIDTPRWNLFSPDDQATILFHESIHVGCLHVLRGKQTGSNRWAIAADFAVNEILHSSGVSLMEGTVLDEHKMWKKLGVLDKDLQPEHRRLSLEEYLAEIPDHSCEMDGPGCIVPCPEGEEQAVIERVQQAIAAAPAGTLKGQFEGVLEQVLKGPPAWLGLLRRFARGVARSLSWRSFNRKVLSSGVYLPARRSPGHRRLVFCIDTSGSVPDADLKEHFGTIRGILMEEPPEEIVILQFDCEVQRIDHLRRGESWPTPTIYGRGGTSFIPPLEEAKRLEADAVIVLTDGEGPWPSSPPPFPLLWVMTGEVKPPYGIIAQIERR